MVQHAQLPSIQSLGHPCMAKSLVIIRVRQFVSSIAHVFPKETGLGKVALPSASGFKADVG